MEVSLSAQSLPASTNMLPFDILATLSSPDSMHDLLRKTLSAVLAEDFKPLDSMEEETEDLDGDVPTATATENDAGGIDLNIDLSVLQGGPGTALLTNRLLGPHWASRLPTRHDFAGRKILTLTDYKRRQGIV